MADPPLVSIVTPSYNQAQFIDTTIRSVLDQSYPRIEYLVIDGGSTDGTLDVLARFTGRLRWLSEPDRGQADAINKGFRLATGSIFGWLNADDLYLPGTVETVVRYFEAHPDSAFVYGDAEAIDGRGRSYGLRIHVRQTDHATLVNLGDNIVQPAAFWRRDLWEAVGELDSDLHYALDYEYWMRAAERFPLTYLPVCLARERLHGAAKTSRGERPRLQEIEQIAVRHGGSGVPGTYRAEAAAAETAEALRSLAHGQWREAVSGFRVALRMRPPLLRWFGYTVLISLFGGGVMTRWWLALNGLRRWRKRGIQDAAGIS